jgi:hypothetical protein
LIREFGIEDYEAILDLWQRAGLETLRPEGRDSREGLRVTAALVLEDNAPSLRLFTSEGYRVARHVLYLSKRDSPDS